VIKPMAGDTAVARLRFLRGRQPTHHTSRKLDFTSRNNLPQASRNTKVFRKVLWRRL